MNLEGYRGIDVLIEVLFKGKNKEYIKTLTDWSKNEFMTRKDYYYKKGFSPELSEKGARKYVQEKIYSVMNIE